MFDPIVVVPMVDEFGSDASGETYLRIIIVFDGDQKRLDSSWTSSFIRRIRPKLIEAGIEEFPSPSWVEKSDWQHVYRKWRHLHLETNLDPLSREITPQPQPGTHSARRLHTLGAACMPVLPTKPKTTPDYGTRPLFLLKKEAGDRYQSVKA